MHDALQIFETTGKQSHWLFSLEISLLEKEKLDFSNATV